MSPLRTPRSTVTTRPMARRKRRRRAIVALGVTSALIAGTAYGTWRYIEENEYLLEVRCEVGVDDQTVELSPEQTHNAATLAVTAIDRGLPAGAAVDALAISMQESELQIRETEDDRDSRVLFARGVPDWSEGSDGEPVETSIEGFYSVLEDSLEAGQEDDDGEAEGDGEDSEEDEQRNWEPGLELDEVAEILERPHNPQFYPQHGTMAEAYAEALTGQQPADLTCHLSQLEAPGPDPEGVVEELAAVMPNALEIPFPEAEEDAEAEDADSEEAESEPEPILDGIVELSGSGEESEILISVPEGEDATDYQWMVAHWAVAVADTYGIQTVTSDPYQWDRSSGDWETVDDEITAESGTVTIGFEQD
ncbi:hypothetical protein HGQ17_11765 [Nesterenkonia sp. MY13]|uniref:Heavy metal transporter n=1 Tax=Nesterenkonia sedimenti TaxID=1463632 RepID=A0A7X8TL85_9MICC|nr:hypothetical protein [Nesterenkonia sedimenti]NLS10654.1 hypothetical protein [Nesterenkonia sedimenti]